MERKSEKIHPDHWLRNLPEGDEPSATDSAGFKPEEMLACAKCGRANPPNRLKCLYCGILLPVSEKQFVKLNLRKLETWEKGFNVIFTAKKTNPDETQISEIAELLQFKREDFQKVLDANKSLPIARTESEAEAEIIAERIAELSAESFVLSDEKLQTEVAPRRLRSIEFVEDKLILILFNADEIAEIMCADLGLIVAGASFTRKIKSVERHRRKKENKILELSEFSSAELLIDVYSRADYGGYRIESKGFDFSCLEAEKQLLAGENMNKLLAKLRAFAGGAKFDDDYRRVRAQLNRIWEAEQKNDSKGLQKTGFGKINLESVTTVNNLSQFTKYSRLQRHLL